MGIKDYIKKQNAQRQERAAYNRAVARQAQFAARQSYAKESIVQARLAAQRKAKAQYNKPAGGGFGGFISGIGRATYNVAERATRPRTQSAPKSYRTKTSYVKVGKKYKKVSRRVAVQPRRMSAPKSNNSNLFSGSLTGSLPVDRIY